MPIAPTADFDWNNDNDAVVLPEQPATACYRNPRGEIVIRQQAAWDQDEDSFILILPQNARRLAQAILNEAPPLRPSNAPQNDLFGFDVEAEAGREAEGDTVPELMGATIIR